MSLETGLIALVGMLITALIGVWIGQARIASDYAATIKIYRDELDNEIKARRIDREACAEEVRSLNNRIDSLEQNGVTYEIRFTEMSKGIAVLTSQIKGHASEPKWTLGDK